MFYFEIILTTRYYKINYQFKTMENCMDGNIKLVTAKEVSKDKNGLNISEPSRTKKYNRNNLKCIFYIKGHFLELKLTCYDNFTLKTRNFLKL